MKYNAPRGTHDLWGKQAQNLKTLENRAREVFMRYGYSEIVVPTFEDAGLFTRSIGDATDIVEKEMYVFEDRKGRKLALRPEGTASIVRSYVEQNLAQALPVSKFFYSGSMFRYERPQAGRYREFYQIGAEYFGNAAPAADAEIILCARDVLEAAGIKDMVIHLHTLGCPACRAEFKKALAAWFSPEKNAALIEQLCSDCKRRLGTNPLRVLDCKIDSQKFSGVPRMEEFLCADCRDHFTQVRELLDSCGCLYEVDHRLVRGLDYYTRTIFEVRSKALGSQDALAAGGRYDNLVHEIGGAQTPAVGFALGSERVILAANAAGSVLEPAPRNIIFIAVAAKELEKEAVRTAAILRKTPSAITIEGPFADKSLKSQFRLADKLGASKVIIFAPEEHTRHAVLIRDMKTQSQQELPLTNIGDGVR
ncbi:MAG: histidine--tRNA ligase [Elusimicrobia bacterium RIFOXYA2_FULL_50_26]|nr:MAG: histidine--tRNA ligase [Elusimicrobia bacterium RIFOXYA2_FULL_50_26]OGS24283.1 MAG: histidine--tRNA ligase [Elusimicrobia bacterium RIFOXYB2_FULL_50_12]